MIVGIMGFNTHIFHNRAGQDGCVKDRLSCHNMQSIL
ncbi:hypothetical protein CGLAMM_08565 [Acetobacteraceae bacterium EV16G]